MSCADYPIGSTKFSLKNYFSSFLASLVSGFATVLTPTALKCFLPLRLPNLCDLYAMWAPFSTCVPLKFLYTLSSLEFYHISVPLSRIREEDKDSLSKNTSTKEVLGLVGNREDRIRTCDTLVPNQVLYQAELLPVICKR